VLVFVLFEAVLRGPADRKVRGISFPGKLIAGLDPSLGPRISPREDNNKIGTLKNAISRHDMSEIDGLAEDSHGKQGESNDCQFKSLFQQHHLKKNIVSSLDTHEKSPS